MLKSSGHLAVCAGFAIFLWVNGGVALGDKGAHMPTVHVMQLPYFALVTCAAFGLAFDVPNR